MHTMQRNIKFTHGGSSSIFGNFAPGDTLRCGADAAKHFVEEACCAVYADETKAAAAAAPAAAPEPEQEPEQAGNKQSKRRQKA
jgi:hypothetical protein